MGLEFKILNEGWNAEPNSPNSFVLIDRSKVVLRFAVNAFLFRNVNEEDVGLLSFAAPSRYRLGPTNDEGWHRGQCRYSRLAPEWGMFYELVGEDHLILSPRDWHILSPDAADARHFMFYLRDGTFECLAQDWYYRLQT